MIVDCPWCGVQNEVTKDTPNPWNWYYGWYECWSCHKIFEYWKGKNGKLKTGKGAGRSRYELV